MKDTRQRGKRLNKIQDRKMEVFPGHALDAFEAVFGTPAGLDAQSPL
jgi:hypothetical protein